MPEMKRWTVTVFLRGAKGPICDVHHIEELEELQAIIEGGPDWRAIDKIEIRYALPVEEIVVAERSTQ